MVDPQFAPGEREELVALTHALFESLPSGRRSRSCVMRVGGRIWVVSIWLACCRSRWSSPAGADNPTRPASWGTSRASRWGRYGKQVSNATTRLRSRLRDAAKVQGPAPIYSAGAGSPAH